MSDGWARVRQQQAASALRMPTLEGSALSNTRLSSLQAAGQVSGEDAHATNPCWPLEPGECPTG